MLIAMLPSAAASTAGRSGEIKENHDCDSFVTDS
jgi:hypothetical protein